jgi:hypothetical protein
MLPGKGSECGHCALTVRVNEGNAQARVFYEALDFTVIGRSPLDAMGHPFPRLHMTLQAPQPASGPA